MRHHAFLRPCWVCRSEGDQLQTPPHTSAAMSNRTPRKVMRASPLRWGSSVAHGSADQRVVDAPRRHQRGRQDVGDRGPARRGDGAAELAGARGAEGVVNAVRRHRALRRPRGQHRSRRDDRRWCRGDLQRDREDDRSGPLVSRKTRCYPTTTASPRSRWSSTTIRTASAALRPARSGRPGRRTAAPRTRPPVRCRISRTGSLRRKATRPGRPLRATTSDTPTRRCPPSGKSWPAWPNVSPSSTRSNSTWTRLGSARF